MLQAERTSGLRNESEMTKDTWSLESVREIEKFEKKELQFMN